MSAKEYSSYAKELRAGRPVIAQTVGDSMQPLLRQGETQVVLLPLSRPLQVGDLPLYQRPSGQYVLHRVVKVEHGECYTRGDNRFDLDLEHIEPAWVLGITDSVVRHGKTVSVTSPGYRLYVAFWLGSYPVRKILNRLSHIPSFVRRKLAGNRNRS